MSQGIINDVKLFLATLENCRSQIQAGRTYRKSDPSVWNSHAGFEIWAKVAYGI